MTALRQAQGLAKAKVVKLVEIAMGFMNAEHFNEIKR